MEEQLKRLAEEMEQVRSPPGHHEENLGYRKIPTILREITVQSHRKASLICCACPGSDRLNSWIFWRICCFGYAI